MVATLERRPYRQRARAAAASALTERIHAAAVTEFQSRAYVDVTLAAIAERAGCNLHTVLRRFGSKDGLFRRSAELEHGRMLLQRGMAPSDDPAEAVRLLVDHYEQLGPVMCHFLAQEATVPQIAEVTSNGRAYHQAWVRATFGPCLRPRPRSASDVRVAKLIVLSDLVVWRILRLDLGRDRASTERIMFELVAAELARGQARS